MDCKNCGKPKRDHYWVMLPHHEVVGFCEVRYEPSAPEPSGVEPTLCPICDAPRVDGTTAYECGSWHTDKPESFVDHCSEPSSPEPTNTLETQCYICPKCGDDHLSSMPCEPSAPEPSGVEWRERLYYSSDECIEQLQQVCTEQADRIAALEADNKRIVIMVESMNEVILKGGE